MLPQLSHLQRCVMARRLFLLLGLMLLSPSVQAYGLLIPSDAKLPPLAMVNHKVSVAIQDQVAVTTLEQTFRNHTDRNLEATYIFPVPRGASVNKFSMWIDGRETAGELLDSKKAHSTYTEIVRRTQDPGLLEYLGNDMMRLRVFPIPPRGDQKIKISFTSVSTMEQGVVEYIYPLKTDGKGTRTLKEFSVKLSIKSQHPVQSIYSPTHAIDIKRKSANEVNVEFEKEQAILDKDFQLFYGLGKTDIGLTPLLYRPVSSEDGYFLLLMSPQVEAAKKRVPRDLVLVLDTSGSMSDVKMSQAKKALKLLLENLNTNDRFSVIAFSSTVRHYEEQLIPATFEQVEKAKKWVEDLRPGGGTAIQPALDAALDLRGKELGRSFTICFFTDGLPTLDEVNPDKIVKNVLKRTVSQENTRIFTFGVGDDVSATLLDQLAESTRAVSTYVRPAEDIEAKASSLNSKISHPVMTNVKLSTTNVKLHEIYPPKLPDLFQGTQLIVMGRYTGNGPAAITLTGLVGSEERELVYELKFPKKTDDSRDFVEQLWARRKVGYLLDQIRINGESKEVVREVTSLAVKYGIATPYTSYLVVPDGPMPLLRSDAGSAIPLPPGAGGPVPLAAMGSAGGIAGPGAKPRTTGEVLREAEQSKQTGKGDGIAQGRGTVQDRLVDEELKKLPPEKRTEGYAKALEKSQLDAKSNRDALLNFQQGQLRQNQQGRLGVDLAEASNNLRNQSRLTISASRQVYGRNCVEIGGVWIDESFQAKTPTVNIRSQSDAYFKLLDKHPKMKEVFRLGNHFAWITPSGVALIVDATVGEEKLSDEQLTKLFEAPAKKN
jgi:Ca-activated chloride channel homolog